MSYNPKIRIWREKRGMKQAAAARALKMNQQKYSLLETGKRKMTAVLADKFSKVFNAPIEDFLLPNGTHREEVLKLKDKIEMLEKVDEMNKALHKEKDAQIAALLLVIKEKDQTIEMLRGKKKK